MINVEEHSSEEDTKSKRIEGMLAEDLKNIVESLKNVYEITVGKHVNKGKNAIQNFDEGESSNHAVVEHNIEYADAQGL